LRKKGRRRREEGKQREIREKEGRKGGNILYIVK